MPPIRKQKSKENEDPTKPSQKKKMSWSDRIDLSENIMLIVIVCIVMAVLAFLATKMF